MTWQFLYVPYMRIYQVSQCYWNHTNPHSLLRQYSHENDVQIQRSSHYGPCEVATTPRFLHAANNIRSTSSSRIFRKAGARVRRRPDSLNLFCHPTSKLRWMIPIIDLHNCMYYIGLKSSFIYESTASNSKMRPPSRRWSCFFTGDARHVSREKSLRNLFFFFRMQQSSIGKNDNNHQNDIHHEIMLLFSCGTRWHSSLRHCTTSR